MFLCNFFIFLILLIPLRNPIKYEAITSKSKAVKKKLKKSNTNLKRYQSVAM